MRSALLAIAFTFGVGGPAMAAACFVPYAEFEKTVPHVDLEACPGEAGASKEAAFCRLGLEGDHVRVYRFRFGTEDACLERIDSYAYTEFVARFGTTQTGQ
jgi:hypothetical protein